MTVEDLITSAPYELQGVDLLGDRRRHLIGVRAQTASPLNGFVDNANRMINADDATAPRRPSRSGVVEVFVAEADDAATLDVQEVEHNPEPGASAAAVLLKATTQLSTWLNLNQKQIAALVGISPSTVMAWRRAPATHPRHSNVPRLLRLWAAVSSAREELGEIATLQLIYGSREHLTRNAATLNADELTEKLLAAAEAASLEAFEDTSDYDPDGAVRPSTGQLADDEEMLSRSLAENLMDSGESATE
ncbi:antitoxin Xre-like helix-turn-helix domain-containing protein [Actinoplanes solisilvae]|uniref:antitoxin Xre-like helix-turn-helix domain-containing protein n=1 Tax=Actinoplanes solisilvae TaxID=2486853 RepID=UPI000FDC0A3B|nr:antitoxin Xre-like helix-turn-helix domain-containing protein [Actinoplanes solisilvae]